MDLTILIVVGLILFVGIPRRNRYGKNKKKDKEIPYVVFQAVDMAI